MCNRGRNAIFSEQSLPEGGVQCAKHLSTRLGFKDGFVEDKLDKLDQLCAAGSEM